MDSLRDHAELREFILENVEQLGEKRVLGTGSYGSVQEVSVYSYSSSTYSVQVQRAHRFIIMIL